MVFQPCHIIYGTWYTEDGTWYNSNSAGTCNRIKEGSGNLCVTTVCIKITTEYSTKNTYIGQNISASFLPCQNEKNKITATINVTTKEHVWQNF